jgi:hypothetical protein
MLGSIIKQVDNTNLKFNLKLLKPFFKKLTLDYHDKKLYNLEPFRARKILYVRYKEGNFFVDKSKKCFTQDVDDVRRYKRKFALLYPNKKEQLIIYSFLQSFINLIYIEQPIARKTADITLHFVKIITNKKGQTNSPEGIHRDGFDVLMPCFVVERKGIKGGISRFFLKNKCIFKKLVNEGQGLYLFENKYKNVFHDVTPIYSLGNKGYRCIIGIDINFK